MCFNNISIKKTAQLVMLFLFGGTAYGMCELIWRGYTHFSMVILGGICFCIIFTANKKYQVLPFGMRCLFSGLFITSMELVCGCIVNIVFKLNVWDYSMMPFNFMGQVCLYFFVLWVFLSIPVLVVCRAFGEYLS